MALQPALDWADLPARLADLPCQPPAELLELWTWRNGQAADSPLFLWYHHFLSLEQSLAEYETLVDASWVAWPVGRSPALSRGRFYVIIARIWLSL